MPELPEVEAARELLDRVLAGREIASVHSVVDPILFVGGITPRRLSSALVGRKVKAARRKGKHLWLELDRRPWLALHLGMTGSIREIGDGPPPRAWKIRLVTRDGGGVIFSDPRRFGRVRLQQDPPHEPPISDLGFDPLEGLPAVAELHALLQRRARAIKPLLLDQAIFAGVGNWVADEVLYQAGISPHRAASSLSRDEARRLRTSILGVIRTAVAAGADARRFPKDWLFHHRWSGRRSPEQPEAASGRRRRAARPEGLVRETIGGRTAAWDPARQR